MLELDKWIEKLKKTEYLAEDELKALCDYVGASVRTFPSCIVREKEVNWLVRLLDCR